jgi:16S rRNA processing protein RimM
MPVNEYSFLVGTIVGFHALSGEVKIRPSTNNPDLLAALKTVRLEPAASKSSGTQPAPAESESLMLKIRSIRVDRKMLLLAFHGYSDRTAVEQFEGARVFCRQQDLLPLEGDEFWIKDLVGVDVFTTDGRRIGKVVSIIYGGNDLMEIQAETDPPGKTILVPFVQDLVPLVDLKNKRVEVVDVPGLLEPQ